MLRGCTNIRDVYSALCECLKSQRLFADVKYIAECQAKHARAGARDQYGHSKSHFAGPVRCLSLAHLAPVRVRYLLHVLYSHFCSTIRMRARCRCITRDLSYRFWVWFWLQWPLVSFTPIKSRTYTICLYATRDVLMIINYVRVIYYIV